MAAPRKGKPRAAARAVASSSAEEVLSAARSGSGPCVVLAHGREHFSRERFIAKLRALYLAPGFEGFNESVRFGEEVDGAALAAEADLLPFGGGRRVIVIRHADAIPEREMEPIARWAANPSPSTALLLSAELIGDLAGLLSASGARVEFAPPRDYQLAAWLERQAKEEGLKMDAEAARAVAAGLSEDWAGAVSVMRRAALAAAAVSGAGAGRITRAVVERVMERGRDANLFHLADLVMGRQPAQAVRVLRDLIEAGESAYTLLPRISGQIGRFMALRDAIDRGVSAEEAVRAASPNLPPMIRSRTARTAASYSQQRLVAAMRMVRATDQAVKGSGSATDVAHMEALIFSIAAL